MIEDGTFRACSSFEHILRHGQSTLSGLKQETWVSAGDCPRLPGVVESPLAVAIF